MELKGYVLEFAADELKLCNKSRAKKIEQVLEDYKLGLISPCETVYLISSLRFK